MTSALEKIVRPFQNGDVFNARVLAPDQPATGETPENVVFEFAGSADAKWTEEPPPVTMGFTVEWNEDKSRRKTESVRVENPDDSSQFVMIERVKKMVFKNDKSGEELPLNMDWS